MTADCIRMNCHDEIYCCQYSLFLFERFAEFQTYCVPTVLKTQKPSVDYDSMQT